MHRPQKVDESMKTGAKSGHGIIICKNFIDSSSI